MDSAIFYNEIRPRFGGVLNSNQVAGMNALLFEGAKAGLSLQHMANVLAQVRCETGGMMYPIKETVQASHKDKLPSDAEVISRLDRAYQRGQLKWVKTPYWQTGMFGRGFIQITHEPNYNAFSKLLGIDLLKNKDLALDLTISAQIAVLGMQKGLFTGKKLSDYTFPSAVDLEPKLNPRRIVNGQDGTDESVAAHHKQFAMALASAGWSKPKATAKPVNGSSLIQLILKLIKGVK